MGEDKEERFHDTMSVTAPFTIAKLWNQPTSPTTNEWIKKTLQTILHCVYMHIYNVY
jgi:hypothetical protein